MLPTVSRLMAPLGRKQGLGILRTLTTSKNLQNQNAQDIEKLNIMIKRKLAEIEQLEKKRLEDEAKPKLSDFTRPILLTFVISSTVYLTYHLIWWNLEYEEREKELQRQLELKEIELQRALDETSAFAPQQKKSWYRRLKFW